MEVAQEGSEEVTAGGEETEGKREGLSKTADVLCTGDEEVRRRLREKCAAIGDGTTLADAFLEGRIDSIYPVQLRLGPVGR